jgi:hypothetical protein
LGSDCFIGGKCPISVLGIGTEENELNLKELNVKLNSERSDGGHLKYSSTVTLLHCVGKIEENNSDNSTLEITAN